MPEGTLPGVVCNACGRGDVAAPLPLFGASPLLSRLTGGLNYFPETMSGRVGLLGGRQNAPARAAESRIRRFYFGVFFRLLRCLQCGLHRSPDDRLQSFGLRFFGQISQRGHQTLR